MSRQQLLALGQEWVQCMRSKGLPRMPDAQVTEDGYLSFPPLERVGLTHRADFPAAHLSGGERQRVAIARALVGRPAVVLADEPTGNLDSVAGQGVIELLRELNTDGVTIVVITHDERIAAAMRRRVELRDGRVVLDTGSGS